MIRLSAARIETAQALTLDTEIQTQIIDGFLQVWDPYLEAFETPDQHTLCSAFEQFKPTIWDVLDREMEKLWISKTVDQGGAANGPCQAEPSGPIPW